MEENLYQNIDPTQDNPLQPDKEAPSAKNVLQKIRSDKRLLALSILGVFIFILLIMSLVITLVKLGNNSRHSILTPTQAPMPATPTLINQANLVPTQYLDQFNQIDKNLNLNPEIKPPEIDPEIGH